MSEFSQTEREQVLLAAITGANASPNWLTSDMVDALLGGHGMLNIAVFNIADVIVRELKRGETGRVVNLPPVRDIRQKVGLSQSRFATLLGVSVRTLQDWEQGRRAPSGAARTLLLIAEKNPAALLEVA